MIWLSGYLQTKIYYGPRLRIEVLGRVFICFNFILSTFDQVVDCNQLIISRLFYITWIVCCCIPLLPTHVLLMYYLPKTSCNSLDLCPAWTNMKPGLKCTSCILFNWFAFRQLLPMLLHFVTWYQITKGIRLSDLACMTLYITSADVTHQLVDRSEFAVECYHSEMHCKERTVHI